MPEFSLPAGAVPARVPAAVRLQIVSSSPEPPKGVGWLHEIKHDGHRLVALLAAQRSLKLLSRNGINRTALFRAPFDDLSALDRVMVLDGEIAVPDERGVTHLDNLTDALAAKRSELLAYFALDLQHLDGHDLRRCPIEERKATLRRVLAEAGCERVVYVDHVVGQGAELFERVRAIGAEGIVSKRLGGLYRGREWLKTKCSHTGRFVVIGFQELGPGRLEAIHVAEAHDAGGPIPVGQVRFGFAGKRMWDDLNAIRAGHVVRGVVPVEPGLQATVKYFGRHKGGSIRDGVILSLQPAPVRSAWCCDCDAAVAAFDAYETASVS